MALYLLANNLLFIAFMSSSFEIASQTLSAYHLINLGPQRGSMTVATRYNGDENGTYEINKHFLLCHEKIDVWRWWRTVMLSSQLQ